MNHYSDTEKIKEAFYKLFKACSDLILATECINGFQTETREEFKETLNFIKEINFSLGLSYLFHPDLKLLQSSSNQK